MAPEPPGATGGGGTLPCIPGEGSPWASPELGALRALSRTCLIITVNCNNENNSNHPNQSLAEWDGGCIKGSIDTEERIFLETRGIPQASDCWGSDWGGNKARDLGCNRWPRVDTRAGRP